MRELLFPGMIDEARSEWPPATGRRLMMLGGGAAVAGLATAPRHTAASVGGIAIPPTSGTPDNALLQAALDRRGVVRLDRSYVISAPLMIRGGTQLIGDGVGRIVWRGPPAGPILQDSSVPNPTHVNRDILLSGFEIIGNGGAAGDEGQDGVRFYRTGGVTMRDLIVHDVGGSGIRWGNSQIDTADVLIENCTVYDCRTGDGIQGSGRNILVRNNRIGRNTALGPGFGDTGIALLTDFNAATNPDGGHSHDVTFAGNIITGAGSLLNVERQTGIALGPFRADHVTNAVITNNAIRHCHVGIWATVMRGVTISGNTLAPHGSMLTGNLRCDGVSDVRILRNSIAVAGHAAGLDYSAIFLNAQRNVYGASRFDADIETFSVEENLLQSLGRSSGVRLAFGQVNRHPAYVSRLRRGVIQRNRFDGFERPIVFASQFGETPDVCRDVAVRHNTVQGAAQSIVFLAGKPAQYVGMEVTDNIGPARISVFAGTGAPR